MFPLPFVTPPLLVDSSVFVALDDDFNPDKTSAY
jgi:hypothetical protein